MVSLEGEIVPLKKPVKIIPEVEVQKQKISSVEIDFRQLLFKVWLATLSSEMISTLKDSLLECLKASDASGKGLDPAKYPSQVMSQRLSCCDTFLL